MIYIRKTTTTDSIFCSPSVGQFGSQISYIIQNRVVCKRNIYQTGTPYVVYIILDLRGDGGVGLLLLKVRDVGTKRNKPHSSFQRIFIYVYYSARRFIYDLGRVICDILRFRQLHNNIVLEDKLLFARNVSPKNVSPSHLVQ